MSGHASQRSPSIINNFCLVEVEEITNPLSKNHTSIFFVKINLNSPYWKNLYQSKNPYTKKLKITFAFAKVIITSPAHQTYFLAQDKNILALISELRIKIYSHLFLSSGFTFQHLFKYHLSTNLSVFGLLITLSQLQLSLIKIIDNHYTSRYIDTAFSASDILKSKGLS